MSVIRGWVILLICSTSAEICQAQSRLRNLTQFQVNTIGFRQTSGGAFLSGQVSWNPTLPLWKSVYLRGNLAITLFRSQDTAKYFPVPEYTLMLGLRLKDSLGLHFGGGAQTWINQRGTSPLVTTELALLFKQNKLKIVDRIFAGYSALLYPGDLTHQFKLGVGIAL